MDMQRILSALNCDLLLSEITKFNEEDDSSSASDNEINITETKTKPPKIISYGNVTKHQQFIKNLLEESTDSSEDEISVEEQLQVHQLLDKYRQSAKLNDKYKKYKHFSCDVLTGEDQWITHYRTIPRKKLGYRGGNGSKKLSQAENDDLSFFEYLESDKTISSEKLRLMLKSFSNTKRKSHGSRKLVDISVIRKNVWKNIAKKEIPKAYRQRYQNQVSKFTLLKKVSKEGSKHVQRKALISCNISRREVKVSLARRLTREAGVYWKKFDREERSKKKQAEKEAMAQRKLDEVFKETCEQHKKLNFLITQTELFAHVISKKINRDSVKDEELWNKEKQRILSQLVIPESSVYSSHLMEYSDDQQECSAEKMIENVQSACTLQESKTKEFSTSKTNKEKVNAAETSLLNGKLTGYQVKGVQWLASLYSNGLNGILADDMGLGKTVQTIAFLAHLAEHNQIWGPFLVVAPASTLNNWHQEFARFLPDFKVLPYWGNTTERKVLRLFWSKNTKFQPASKSPFHVLVTSYQLVISDIRYFQQISWEYLILDEAQALKSSSSQRWKSLLDFNCRNRLLLTGTPVQNTMAELWALLHFIMPTLFDNHAEFNEWFSKNIESHAENKSNVNTADLSRLHMILKPFMLRRVKSEVEHELTDKIEIRMLCHLAPRQRLLYDALQKNITVNDLMRVTSTSAQANSNNILMNLVMQFRKMCNHPDLFKANYNLTKFYFHPRLFHLSTLIYHQFLSRSFNHSKAKILYSDFNIHTPTNVYRSLSKSNGQSCFSFLSLMNLSMKEYFDIFRGSIFERFYNAEEMESNVKDELHHILYSSHCKNKKLSFHKWACICLNCTNVCIKLHLIQDRLRFFANKKSIFRNLLFAQNYENFLSNLDCTITAIVKESCSSADIKNQLCRRAIVWQQHCVPTSIPRIISSVYFPNVYSLPSNIYCNDSHALNKMHHLDSELNKFKKLWQKVPCFTPINFPDREQLVIDSGKLQALDILLRRLKDEGHRVLVYSQMTKMIDILEEYLIMKSHTYVRLDGSSRISSRRDAVAGFQSRDDIFVFLLSTRAGGLGINLTAADTVIFYDSDWNPAVDQQAMDRAHRLGQTKQVTVYRLVCSGTVDERILERAEAKRTIQRLVISGTTAKVDSLKPKEVYTLLLDDNQISNNPQLTEKDVVHKTVKKERVGKKRGRKPKVQKAVASVSLATEEDEHIIVVDDNITSDTSSVLRKNQNISDKPIMQGCGKKEKSSHILKSAKRHISTPLNTDSIKKRRGRKVTSSKF